ncbi:MAG TPA: crosslink repair DNA glycosylase YcaQ family protein [Trebonia sp.]
MGTVSTGTVHRLSRQDARRIAVRAQLLTDSRPPDLLAAVRQLTTLQLDPVSAVAPSADLVAWSRLGPAYRPDDLKAAVASQSIIELRSFLRPAEDFALYRADMASWPGHGELRAWQVANREWVAANDKCRREILARLAAGGPLQSRELPDTCERPWQSTGWTNNKNVTMLLEFMVSRGEVAVAGRRGKERLWDLAERVYPGHPVIPAAEAARERDRRRLQALGIARISGPETMMEPAIVSDGTGEAAEIEDVKGRWRVDPRYLGSSLDDAAFEGRAALLSPFDRLVHDRVRALDIFEYEYQLEMYKPAAKRRWGYYALPVLYGDRLVGKLDATADRKAGVFRVSAVHQDVPFTADMSAAVADEINALATWLGLEVAGL